MDPLPRDVAAAAEAPPALLDALARAPVAAALVVAALDRLDRGALRLAHTQLRDAVGEVRTISVPDLAALEALASEAWPARSPWRPGWSGLSALRLKQPFLKARALDAPAARALAAALRRMPALRALELQNVLLPDPAAAALFHASRDHSTLRLREVTIALADLSPAAVRALAATGWRLEELDLSHNSHLNGRMGGAGSAAALVAAPTFALRRLSLASCRLDATALLTLANAPWPLEELNLASNNFSAAAAGPALAALSRHAGLRKLDVSHCRLSAVNFKALVEAAWPALIYLDACFAKAEFAGPHALGGAAFAGFPALEELDLAYVPLGAAGAALLASRRWARLKMLYLTDAGLGDAGLAALSRGAWPALVRLHLRGNGLGTRPTLEDARRWAPALRSLHRPPPRRRDFPF
jgi:hypothetical protein